MPQSKSLCLHSHNAVREWYMLHREINTHTQTSDARKLFLICILDITNDFQIKFQLLLAILCCIVPLLLFLLFIESARYLLHFHNYTNLHNQAHVQYQHVTHL